MNGITSETYENFIIDVGALFINFVDVNDPGTLLGATRGGSSFSLDTNLDEMPADGAMGPVIGSRRIKHAKASITTNVIEHTLSGFLRALVGSDSVTFDTLWDAITREAQISDTDYISSLALVGQVSGRDEPVIVKLDNVLVDSNFELTLADKEEGVLPMTFTAHADADDIESEPWAIYWPKKFEIQNLLEADGLQMVSADGFTLQVRLETT